MYLEIHKMSSLPPTRDSGLAAGPLVAKRYARLCAVDEV
jgi:hypothetical protein